MRHGHRNGGTAISEMEMRQVYRDEDTDIDATGSVKHASAPAAHATQSVSASLPVDGREVPLGHACLSLDPPGQVNPAGHGTPSLDVDPGGQ